MTHRLLALCCVLPLSFAAPAAGQDIQEPAHKQSVSVAAHWAYPLSAEDLVGTPGMNVSWRRWFGPHLGIEGHFGFSRRTVKEEYRADGYQGVNGFVSEPIEALYRGEMNAYGAGLNVIGRLSAGRVAFMAGGGPGVFAEHVSTLSSINGSRYDWSATSWHFGLQSLAELEVRVTHGAALFGGLRIEVRDVRYPDSMVAYPTTGVRFSF